MGRAPIQRGLALVIRSACDDDVDVEQIAQADRHGRNAARPPVYQHCIATDDIGALEQIGPNGKKRLRHSRRFDHVVTFGNR